MDCYSSDYMMESLWDKIYEERDRNEKLSMRNDALEEEISYLRPMVKWLIEHIEGRLLDHEISTVLKIEKDLEYFKEKNYDIEDEHGYK